MERSYRSGIPSVATENSLIVKEVGEIRCMGNPLYIDEEEK